MTEFALILAGLALLWAYMLNPGDVTATTESGKPLGYEGGGLLRHIGRAFSRYKAGDAFGLCPVCFGFWLSVAFSFLMWHDYRINLLEAAGIVAITHLIIRTFIKYKI